MLFFLRSQILWGRGLCGSVCRSLTNLEHFILLRMQCRKKFPLLFILRRKTVIIILSERAARGHDWTKRSDLLRIEQILMLFIFLIDFYRAIFIGRAHNDAEHPMNAFS